MGRISILIMLAFFSLPVFSQVSIQFIPELNGRSLNGLLNSRIINMSGRKDISLSVTVTEKKSGRVVTIKTPPFSLAQGNNSIPAAAARAAKVQFAANALSSMIKQTDNLPSGEYEYCYTVSPVAASQQQQETTEQCFDFELTPAAPLNLIEPANQDKICEKRPLLSWQPSFPAVAGSSYQLLLVEVKDRQSAVEALNYNLPLVSQSGIINPVLPYPASYKELQQGKKYAWQVTHYKNQTVLNRSEVWEFTLDCETADTTVTPILTDDGYRDVEDLLRGNYYVARGAVKFALINAYQAQPMKYSVQCITDPAIRIKKLPEVKLTRGKNKINIPLSSNKAFKEGYSYILHIIMPNGSTKDLRFIYREG